MMKKIVYILLAFAVSLPLYAQIKNSDKLLDSTSSKLKVAFPNGGESLLVGGDTLIKWEGVLPSDNIKLSYSTDNGTSWNVITYNATGMEYRWTNIPNFPGNQCLIKAKLNNYSMQPIVEWQKTYGGIKDENINVIAPTNDGGYITAGYSSSQVGSEIDTNKGWSDYWVMKIDKKGKVQWYKTYGGGRSEVAYSIQQTTDKGFIIAGKTDSKYSDGDVKGHHNSNSDNGEYADYWIVKLDSVGDLKWQKCLGGTNFDEAYSIRQTNDGGYIVSGESCSNNGDVKGVHPGYYNSYTYDSWIVKLDTMGNIQWQKAFGGSGNESTESIRQTKDGGYIAAGTSTSSDGDVIGHHGKSTYLSSNADVWIIKLDSAGSMLWQKSLGGDDPDGANSVEPTSDGGYIVAGWTQSKDGDVTGNNGWLDFWVIKIDSLGNLLWQKALGGSNVDQSLYVHQTVEGGYIVAGNSRSKNGDITNHHGDTTKSDYWIVKLDTEGDIQWQESLGGTGVDEAKSILETPDGGFIVAGNTMSNDGDVTGNQGFDDGWIVKLRPTGLRPNIQDVSDSTWSIIKPTVGIQKIDMKQCPVGQTKDSTITSFFTNYGDYNCRVDSIYISGIYAIHYSMQGLNFPISVPVGSSLAIDIKFKPTSIGIKNAKITVITQSDTLYQILTGEGTEPSSVKDELKSTTLNRHSNILSIAPNPAENSINIDLSLTEVGNTELSVYNVIGERVKLLANEDVLSLGKRTVTADISDLGTGQYIVVLRTPTIVQKKILMIVK